MKSCLPLFVLWVAALTLRAGEAPPPSLRETVNSLDDPQVQKAIESLQANFLSPSALDENSRQKAMLEGLLRRLSPGAAIVTADKAKARPEPVPFLAEILDDRAGYLRPGKLDAATISQMDVSLANFSDKKLPAVILDLERRKVRTVPILSFWAGSRGTAAAPLRRRGPVVGSPP